MSSNSEVLCTAAVDGAVVTHLVIADLAGHDEDAGHDKDDAQDAAHVAGHTKDADAPDAEGAVIHRIDAAVDALGDVDFGTWSDSSLSGHLDELSLVLCRIDAELSRLADAVRSRGFDIAEIDLPLAS
jgi:hypothetical protein